MSVYSPFNLDLTLIETILTDAGMYVQPALVMPLLLKEPLLQDTCFVMLLDDSGKAPDEIGGFDMQQYTTERFAVVLGLRALGDSTGVNATAQLQDAIKTVKTQLIGLIFDKHDPIEYEGGRIIDVNRETQTVLYQLQFKTAHTVVIQVRDWS